MRTSTRGTLKDIDVEYLHDLRVATRRTRSALTQLNGVISKDLVNRFMVEFKWLSNVTGPCRDLDVLLSEMESYRSILVQDALDFVPLEQHMMKSRRTAYQELCKRLQSVRLTTLFEDWGRFLGLETPNNLSPSRAGCPIRDLASVRILKAHRRMMKRGRCIGDNSPADRIHQLRIDGKKLRYLLEFFRSLYPKDEMVPLIRELKALQDLLGGFNDMEVQQNLLRRLTHGLLSSDSDQPQILAAVDRLTLELKQRQDQYRHDFSGRYAAFSDKPSQQRYRSLFKTEP